MITQDPNQGALTEIRSLAFELIKSSSEKERKIVIEDFGDYCSIKLTIRVIGEEFREALNQAKTLNPQAIGEI